MVSEQHQTFWSVSVFETFVEFMSNLSRNAKSGEEIEYVAKLRGVEKRAATELLNGVGIHNELVVAVARKQSALGT